MIIMICFRCSKPAHLKNQAIATLATHEFRCSSKYNADVMIFKLCYDDISIMLWWYLDYTIMIFILWWHDIINDGHPWVQMHKEVQWQWYHDDMTLWYGIAHNSQINCVVWSDCWVGQHQLDDNGWCDVWHSVWGLHVALLHCGTVPQAVYDASPNIKWGHYCFKPVRLVACYVWLLKSSVTFYVKACKTGACERGGCVRHMFENWARHLCHP